MSVHWPTILVSWTFEGESLGHEATFEHFEGKFGGGAEKKVVRKWCDVMGWREERERE